MTCVEHEHKVLKLQEKLIVEVTKLIAVIIVHKEMESYGAIKIVNGLRRRVLKSQEILLS